MHRWTPPVRPRRRSRWTSEKRLAAKGVKYRYSGVDPGRGRDGQSTVVSRTAGSSELQVRTFGGWPHLTMPALTRAVMETALCGKRVLASWAKKFANKFVDSGRLTGERVLNSPVCNQFHGLPWVVPRPFRRIILATLRYGALVSATAHQ